MFKYEPKPEIVERMRSLRSKWKGFDKEWDYIDSLVGHTYALKMNFHQHYKNVSVCFPKKQKEVPINGYLYPVGLFIETEIKK